MDEALPPEERSLVQRLQHELAATGTMTDDTWQRLMRTMDRLSEEDLRVLIETLARTSPTLDPSEGDGAAEHDRRPRQAAPAR